MPSTNRPRLLAVAITLAAAGLTGHHVAQARNDDPRGSPVVDTYGRPTLTDITRECVRYDFRAGDLAGLCKPKGEAAPAPAAAAPQPAPPPPAPVKEVVETAPLPPPVPVAAPEPAPPPAPPVAAKPAPRRVTLDADTLFAFDSAALQPKGTEQLDTLADELRKVRYESISVTGHADRIGTKAYNERLSERRAQSVKEYLAGHGIEAGRIDARGAGMAQPVTGDKCKGIKKRADLIKCLAPDRRVEVQVAGTAQ